MFQLTQDNNDFRDSRTHIQGTEVRHPASATFPRTRMTRHSVVAAAAALIGVCCLAAVAQESEPAASDEV